MHSTGIIFSQPFKKLMRGLQTGNYLARLCDKVGAICAASRDVVNMILCSAVAGFAGFNLIVDGVVRMLRRGERDAGMERRTFA